jgi:hypothetical protein
MKHPIAGGLFLLSIPLLTACAGPMSQREAQGTAAASLRRWCTQTTPCAPYRITRAQRLGDGWLIDFESTTTAYGVMVHDNSATEVSAWKKPG